LLYLTAFLAAYLATHVVRKLAARHGWLAQPREDRWHTKPTALFGGVGFYPVFFLAMLAVVSERLHDSLPIVSRAFYPYAEISAPGGINMTFLFNGRRDKRNCEGLAAAVIDSMLAVCPTCQVKAKKCLDLLEPQHQEMLSTAPLDLPSARLPDGVLTYHAIDPDTALAACQESARQTSSRSTEAGRIVCYPPKTDRPPPASPENAPRR